MGKWCLHCVKAASCLYLNALLSKVILYKSVTRNRENGVEVHSSSRLLLGTLSHQGTHNYAAALHSSLVLPRYQHSSALCVGRHWHQRKRWRKIDLRI